MKIRIGKRTAQRIGGTRNVGPTAKSPRIVAMGLNLQAKRSSEGLPPVSRCASCVRVVRR